MMERMTKRGPVGALARRGYWASQIIDRLAAYEDTGLEPEEITSMRECYDMYGGSCGITEALKELARYKKSEADGRLVVLPCKVGDVVYVIDGVSVRRAEQCL